jgi:hypothetical protein
MRNYFIPKKIIEKNHHPSKLFNYSLISGNRKMKFVEIATAQLKYKLYIIFLLLMKKI